MTLWNGTAIVYLDGIWEKLPDPRFTAQVTRPKDVVSLSKKPKLILDKRALLVRALVEMVPDLYSLLGDLTRRPLHLAELL